MIWTLSRIAWRVLLKKTDIDKSLDDIVKKCDLETVVTSTVTKLLDSFKLEINEKICEKSNKHKGY